MEPLPQREPGDVSSHEPGPTLDRVSLAVPASADEWRPGWLTRAAATFFGAAALLAVAIILVLEVSSHAGRAKTVAAAVPALREFTLTAQEVDWDLFPGTTVKAWTFGGTVPGPEIRVTEGDLVRVTLQNNLPVPTTIHWHGVDVPNNMDGVPGMTQDAVPPGGSFTYEFVATNPGTRWYHSHQDAEVQVPLGLFGPLIIEPKDTAGAPKYNRDYTYMLSEWSLALTPQVATGEATLPQVGPGAPQSKQFDFDLFLMNGKASEAITPITVKQGERIRIRLINAGSLVHTIHAHGHSFKIVATDGNPVPPAAQLTKDSVTIGPSERVDIEILANNPGVWMFHCHMEHHMANGMMTTIRYEGVADAHDHTAVPVVAAPAGGTVSADDASVASAGTKITLVDNHYQPSNITVPAGTTVAWINKGANVHTVTSLNGTFESGSVLPGKAFTYTFSKPGTYQFLCRQHLLTGMSGTITVQ